MEYRQLPEIRHIFVSERHWDLYDTDNAGKSSVQSSEFDAKSDTNEIKLMVTDHADGNRIPFCIIHHCATATT